MGEGFTYRTILRFLAMSAFELKQGEIEFFLFEQAPPRVQCSAYCAAHDARMQRPLACRLPVDAANQLMSEIDAVGR